MSITFQFAIAISISAVSIAYRPSSTFGQSSSIRLQVDALAEDLKANSSLADSLEVLDKTGSLFWLDISARGTTAISEWVDIANDGANPTRSSIALMAEPDVLLMPLGSFVVDEPDLNAAPKSRAYRRLIRELQISAARRQIQIFTTNPQELLRYARIVLWSQAWLQVGDSAESLTTKFVQLDDQLQHANAEELPWHLRNALIFAAWVGVDNPASLLKSEANASESLIHAITDQLSGGVGGQVVSADATQGIWRIETNKLPLPSGDWPTTKWPAHMPSAREFHGIRVDPKSFLATRRAQNEAIERRLQRIEGPLNTNKTR